MFVFKFAWLLAAVAGIAAGPARTRPVETKRRVDHRAALATRHRVPLGAERRVANTRSLAYQFSANFE